MKKAIILLICLFVPAIALAQQSSTAPEKKKTNNYFGVTAGIVFPEDLESDNNTPGSITSLSDVDLSTGTMIGLKLGHIFPETNNIFAIELEGFMIDGTDVDNEPYYTHSGGSAVNIDADISIKSLMINAIARHPEGKIHPYAGLGIGWVWFDLDDVALTLEQGYVWAATNTRTYEYGDIDDDTFGFQLLAGVDIDLKDDFSCNLGARYFYTEPNFKKEADFDIDTKYKTYIIIVGFKKAF